MHKLLVSGGGNGVANTTTTNAADHLPRLPGGAELNLLHAGSNGAPHLFRTSGKLSLVNNGNGFTFKGEAGRVHVMHQANGTIGLAPIIVSSSSQGQTGINQKHQILSAAAQSQLTGKVVSGGGR